MPRTLALSLLLVVAACRTGPPPRTLTVVAAASMADVIDAASRAFMLTHPGTDIRRESVGSRVGCRYVLEGVRTVDVLLVADAELVRTLLMPHHATFNIVLARDALVVAFPPNSAVATAVNHGVPWQHALIGKRIGYANPATAPLGYRTFLALTLNDRFAPPDLRVGDALRQQLRPADQRPDAAQLVAPLEAGALDAAFLYASEATQHHLGTVALDPRINFGDPAQSATYASVSFTLPGDPAPVRGSPIEYSLTIPTTAAEPVLAAEYVAFLLLPEARQAANGAEPQLLSAEALRLEGTVSGRAPLERVVAGGGVRLGALHAGGTH